MRYLASSIFSSPPPNPRINEILRQTAPPPPPLPPPRKSPALKSVHRRTKFHKPIPPDGGVIAADEHERKVVVGESGVSYLLPGAPFEFQFSYSETPKAKPLAIREPAFLPFAPPSMPRPWTGKAPLKSKKEKDLKKQRNVRLLNPVDSSETEEIPPETVFKMSRSVPGLVQSSSETRSRGKILGKPLTKAEIKALVKPHLSDNRQINLGRDGLTHNMLELIHTHWRRSEVCKVRCRGVPTVDMNNVCRHLEEKTGGKIIHRAGGVVYLFRGRNYDPRTRPRLPVMLWKPATPVYPKLIQEVPEGLTRDEAIEFRKKGETLPPICKLAKNGIYITLVRNVRDAFEGSSLAKIDCRGLHASDFKKIGAKLKELVPCVLLSFDNDQILMWRGRDWKSKYPKPTSLDSSSTVVPSKIVEEGKMAKLWRRALESGTAMLLPEEDMCPDSLRHQIELFEASSLTAAHSFSALVSENFAPDAADEDSGGIDDNDDDVGDNGSFDLFEASSQAVDHSFPALVSENSASDEDSIGIVDDDDDDDYGDEGSLDLVESSVPYGSLGVDTIARSLRLD